jgi:hypothetical protein
MIRWFRQSIRNHGQADESGKPWRSRLFPSLILLLSGPIFGGLIAFLGMFLVRIYNLGALNGEQGLTRFLVNLVLTIYSVGLWAIAAGQDGFITGWRVGIACVAAGLAVTLFTSRLRNREAGLGLALVALAAVGGVSAYWSRTGVLETLPALAIFEGAAFGIMAAILYTGW